MSLIHNIIIKSPLDVARLNKFVATIEGATYEARGENVIYFWINGKSTRGLTLRLIKATLKLEILFFQINTTTTLPIK